MDASPGWDLETPIYSLEQAERGAGIVLEVCSRCHAPEAYTNFDFRFRWSGSSVGELYRFVSATMPQDAPGQLEPEEYAAALAYIFRENRLPAGDRELGTDFSELHRHRLVIPTGP
jgi:mono/diheme cytochrome c family protein